MEQKRYLGLAIVLFAISIGFCVKFGWDCYSYTEDINKYQKKAEELMDESLKLKKESRLIKEEIVDLKEQKKLEIEEYEKWQMELKKIAEYLK